MRTSCDIDILVHENDLEKTTEYLVRDLGYIYDRKGPHDVSLYLQSQLHLELHYTLIGDGVAKSSCEVLKNVWQSALTAGITVLILQEKQLVLWQNMGF